MTEGRARRAWQRVIAGAPVRKTRLHDATGQRVALGRIVRNGPRALGTTILRVVFGIRPERPWLSYDAQAALERHLGPSSVVLEFGSGLSTVWLARRCGQLISVEDLADWHATVSRRLPTGPASIEYRLARDREGYLAVPEGMAFDLVLVDGSFRDDCVEVGLEHLKPGGILYLDNADHARNAVDGDVPRAARLIEEAARERGWRLTVFTDFLPTIFFAGRGLLLQRI